jgi:DNA-binding transcriptional LysR family regulator
VDLGVEVGPYEFVTDKIQREGLDLGIVFTTGPIPGVESRPLWLEPLALYVSKDHALAQMAHSITADQLQRVPLITVPRHTQMRGLLDETLIKVGISDCTVALEADSFAVVNQSLIHNIGFACLFKCQIEASPIRAQLIEIPLNPPPVEARQILSRAARNDPTVLQCINFVFGNVSTLDLV